MGVILLLGYSPALSSSFDAETPDRPARPPAPRWSAGASAVYVQSPYLGQRGRFWGFPAVTYIGPRFQVVGPTLSVRLLQAQPVGVGLDARMRFSPFNERDGGQLQGMKVRRSTLEAGPRVSAFLPLGVRVELSLAADVLNEHSGVDAGLVLFRSWRNGDWVLRPSIRLNYWSAELANHYYGVREDEMTAGRPMYRTGAVWTPAVDLTLTRRLGVDWSVLLSVGVVRVGSAVTASPIVERRTTGRAMGAITYAF